MTEMVEVTVGVVGRAHGVRGELGIILRTDEPERRFAVGATVLTPEGRQLVVAQSREVSGRLLVRFEQVTDRNQAEQLRGTELVARVPESEEPSGDEEYYDRQLIGLEVRIADGQPAGIISEVLHQGAQDLLVVDVAGTERLVPFVQALVPVVDLAGGFVQLADVGGLLDDEAEEA